MVTKSVPPAVSLGTHVVASLTVVMKVATPWVVGDLDGSVCVGRVVVGTDTGPIARLKLTLELHFAFDVRPARAFVIAVTFM